MLKAIVTTTVNKPTKALRRFAEIAERDGWKLIVVGDKKTPAEDHEEFAAEHNPVIYLSPERQAEKWPELSKLVGWNCIQRRNFGLIHAHDIGSEVIATIDDDNIPHQGWGLNCVVGQELEVAYLTTEQPVFDPLAPCFPHIWHRGFPIQFLKNRQVKNAGTIKRKVLVQADFWNGDPDIDAIARISIAPEVRFNENMVPFTSNKISPFNSQNTFLHRSLFPTYFLFPGIGRMDDIWASYVTQFKFPDSVIYSRASVTQERNDHDLYKDLEAEMIGYRNNDAFVQSRTGWESFLPERARKAYAAYERCFSA